MDRQHIPPTPGDRDQLLAERLAVLDRLDVVEPTGSRSSLTPGADHDEVVAIDLDRDIRVVGLDDEDALGRLEAEDRGDVIDDLLGHGPRVLARSQRARQRAGTPRSPTGHERSAHCGRASQLGRQRDRRGLLHVRQAAAQQVGDLGRRPVAVGRVLGVQPVR